MKVENAGGTHVACRMLSIELEKKAKLKNIEIVETNPL